MFRVTCIDLENGEFALYINGHYLSSEDGSGEKLYLGDILERLSRLPGVTTETVERPVPDSDEWSWNDVADSVFPACITLSRNMTVAAFKQRLSRFPDDALCCVRSGWPVIFWRWTVRSRKTISMRRWSWHSTAMMRMTGSTGATCNGQSMR